MLRKFFLSIVLIAASIILLYSSAFAQLRDKATSPVINDDGSISFRIKAP